LRTHWTIPCFVPKEDVAPGELMNIKQAAAELGVVPLTIHRLLNDGIIAGEQLTPGAPWRIRLTNELKACFNANAGGGYLPMREAIRAKTICGLQPTLLRRRNTRGRPTSFVTVTASLIASRSFRPD
jgi:hypothetical protein